MRLAPAVSEYALLDSTSLSLQVVAGIQSKGVVRSLPDSLQVLNTIFESTTSPPPRWSLKLIAALQHQSLCYRTLSHMHAQRGLLMTEAC